MAMVAAVLTLVLAAAMAAEAAQHTVGGTSGWNTGVNYITWVAGATFTVGDTLLFNYGSSHAVDVIDQTDYANCNSGNALKSYSGGNTIISLNATGPMYFMCPTPGHCLQGMKLGINVVAASTSPTSPTPSTPTTTTSSPPPPPTSDGNFGGKNYLLLEISLLVVALVVAFMG